MANREKKTDVLPAAALDGRAGPRVRVMVIDDDPLLGGLLVEAIRHRGYLASNIVDPAAAEEAVRAYGAHVVLCDVLMPGIDGLELTRRLRAHDPATQVVMMSGHADQAMVDRAFELGVVDFLLKPFASLDAVFAALDQGVARMREEEERLREALRREFPGEYEIIYAGERRIPDTGEFAAILAEVEDESSGEGGS